MPFPASWPPRPPSGRRSIRFYVAATATADFEDRAYLLRDALTLLDYAAQVVGFTVGETITGQKSGASAVVTADANTGLTGTLTLSEVNGVFFLSEQVLGDVTGDATTNGSQRTPANTFTSLPEVVSGVPTAVPPTPWGGGHSTEDSPAPMIWANSFRIVNDSEGPLEYSFDGVNVHGVLAAGDTTVYRNRYEAGVAVRGLGVAFWIEAW